MRCTILTTKITELSRDFDPSKQNKLTPLKVDAKNVLFLTPAHGKTKTTRPQDEDDLGLFEGEDIQSILWQMNCKIEFVLWEARVPVLIGIHTDILMLNLK